MPRLSSVLNKDNFDKLLAYKRSLLAAEKIGISVDDMTARKQKLQMEAISHLYSICPDIDDSERPESIRETYNADYTAISWPIGYGVIYTYTSKGE